VRENPVGEVDVGAFWQAGGGAGPLNELGKPGDMVGLDVGLEDCDDRDGLLLSQRDVIVDQIDMWIDDREARLGLASEQIGGAGSLVVEELTEKHALGLTSYQLIA
jgi:hypothetical protein